jgi:hypothetical protein
LANPTRSKVRQEAFEGGPPELPGRPLEVVGNGDRRWMTVGSSFGSSHRTRLIGQLVRRHPAKVQVKDETAGQGPVRRIFPVMPSPT